MDAVDSGKYFCTSADVIAGNPISWLLLIALQRVSTVGGEGIGVGMLLFLPVMLIDGHYLQCGGFLFW